MSRVPELTRWEVPAKLAERLATLELSARVAVDGDADPSLPRLVRREGERQPGA